MTQLENENEPKTRVCFNIRNQILANFKETCDREGKTYSEVIEEQIAVYVKAHSTGKPQLRIDHFNGKTPRVKRCPKCGREAPQLMRVQFISGITGELCKECVEKWRVRGKFGTVKKVLGVT